MDNNDSFMVRLIKFLCRLKDDKFYGEVRVKFEEGEVVVIRKDEAIKL